MAELKLYPVGIQTFEEIITRNLLYVDKTEYVYRMTYSGGKHFFLSGSRRFGKSLLVLPLRVIFWERGTRQRACHRKVGKDWTEYPALHFSMAGGKHMEKEQLERYFWETGLQNKKKYGESRLLELMRIDRLDFFLFSCLRKDRQAGGSTH